MTTEQVTMLLVAEHLESEAYQLHREYQAGDINARRRGSLIVTGFFDAAKLLRERYELPLFAGPQP